MVVKVVNVRSTLFCKESKAKNVNQSQKPLGFNEYQYKTERGVCVFSSVRYIGTSAYFNKCGPSTILPRTTLLLI